MDRHVIEAMGKTKVVIENGKVTQIGAPEVEYCPLFFKYRGIVKITPEIVKENIDFRIKDFGMCTPQRRLRMKDFLSFGVSELLGMAVSKEILDCAVLVCEGAGTAVVDDSELIQGIGGRISGIIETSPIPEIIEAIGPQRLLDPKTAAIDQVEGAAKAMEIGYRTMGVTVASASDAALIREKYGNMAVIFGVHTSGTSAKDAEMLFDVADVVTACASKTVRERARERALLQVGNKVPVYAASPFGVALLQMRMQQLSVHGASDKEDPPRPLI